MDDSLRKLYKFDYLLRKIVIKKGIEEPVQGDKQKFFGKKKILEKFLLERKKNNDNNNSEQTLKCIETIKE